MKHWYLAYLYGGLTIGVFIMTFGLALPALVSAKSDISVILGTIGIGASALAIFELGRSTWKNINKAMKKGRN